MSIYFYCNADDLNGQETKANKNKFTEMEIIIMKQSKSVCLKSGLVESASNWPIQDGIIRN